MQQGIEFLRTLNIKDIHAKTHISFANIEAILNKSYEKLERVNLTGFISILQREYELDLSDFQREFEAYAGEHVNEKPVKKRTVNKPRRSGSKKRWWALLLLIAAGVGFFYTNNFDISVEQNKVIQEVNDSQIEEAKEKIQASEPLQPYLQKHESNSSSISTQEENITETIETVELNATEISKIIEEIAPEVQNEIVTIVPKKKVWIGMIDLSNMKKINRVTSRQIKVDSTKNWLIVFGHGQINIKKDGELLEFSKRGKVYFIYEDGKLKEIKKAEFKKRNQGRTW